MSRKTRGVVCERPRARHRGAIRAARNRRAQGALSCAPPADRRGRCRARARTRHREARALVDPPLLDVQEGSTPIVGKRREVRAIAFAELVQRRCERLLAADSSECPPLAGQERLKVGAERLSGSDRSSRTNTLRNRGANRLIDRTKKPAGASLAGVLPGTYCCRIAEWLPVVGARKNRVPSALRYSTPPRGSFPSRIVAKSPRSSSRMNASSSAIHHRRGGNRRGG